jgi:hypothetical protein
MIDLFYRILSWIIAIPYSIWYHGKMRLWLWIVNRDMKGE